MSTKLKDLFMQYMMESFEEESSEPLESEELLPPEEYLQIAKNAAEENGDSEMVAIVDQSESLLKENFIKDHSYISVIIGLAIGMLIGKFGLDYASAKSLVDSHEKDIQYVSSYIQGQPLSEKDKCIKNARNELAKSMCGWLTSDGPDKVRQQMFRH